MGGSQDATGGSIYKVKKARRVDRVAGGRTHNIRDSMQKGAEVVHTQEGQPGLAHTDSWPWPCHLLLCPSASWSRGDLPSPASPSPPPNGPLLSISEK